MTRIPRLLSLFAALLLALPVVAVTASAAPAGYHVVWSDQFQTLQSVSASQSSPSVNGLVAMTDTSNGQLQKPTVRGDVSVARVGNDGHSLQVATRATRFQTPRGSWYGITNGRASIGPTFNLAGHKVLARLRGVGNGKAANMIWPSKGWPWEVDFAEWFPGSGSDTATARNHKAFDSHGAIHQLVSTTRVNRNQWHTYGIEFLGSAHVTGIRYTVDGHPMQFTENGRTVTTLTGAWVPNGRGALAIGKAVPGPRGSTPLSHFDAVQVDWVQVLAR